MKRIGILLVVLVTLGLVFTSCSRTPPAPPVQPTPIPEPAPTPPPKIEVKWETNGPIETDGLAAVVINDSEGKIVYTIGSLRGGDFHKTYVWNTENGGQTWKLLGLITDPEINFKSKEEIYKKFCSQPTITGSWDSKRDPNNKDILLRAEVINPSKGGPWKFLLSFDNGKSWTELNLPPLSGSKEYFCMFTERYDLISSEGKLKIFFALSEVWQTSVSLPE